MWKIANLPFSGIQRSSDTTTGPPTAKVSPKDPLSTPPTPFLRSKSEVRFALNSDFAFNPKDERRIPPLPPTEPAVTQPNPPTNNTHLSPHPNKPHRIGPATPQKPSNIHVAANPNACYRLSPRQIRLPPQPNERENGPSIPLTGQYVTTFADDVDDGEGDLIRDDLPPGLDDGLQTSLRRFAWAYARGLGGLVMGVVDGLARGAAGSGGGVPARYSAYGAGG